jgi:hypothetical protein
MPSNIIQINCSDELKWVVGDSKMEKLISYLDKIGYRENEEDKNEEDK